MASAEEVTARTPLLSPVTGSTAKEDQAEDQISRNEQPRIEQDLQFYDPASILDIPREVAFGYFILLTGGAVQYEYEAPKQEQATLFQQLVKNKTTAPTQGHENEKAVPQTAGQDTGSRPAPSSKSLNIGVDDDLTSLAYAAIVDGNLLHSCFGLKANANVSDGDSTLPNIGDRKKWPSILCCFPASSVTHDVLQSSLPNVVENQSRMQHLVEVLREVRDLYQEAQWSSPSAADGASDASKASLYVQVIQCYIHLFITVLRYHDNVENTTMGRDSKPTGISKCCSHVISQVNCLFSKPEIDQELDLLQHNSLIDVKDSFQGLKENIWKSLENSASGTSFMGAS